MAGSLPQRSRSQGRPSGAASAGLPLDSGESEGQLSCRSNKQPFAVQLDRGSDRERRSSPTARGVIFLPVYLRCAIHGRKHRSTN